MALVLAAGVALAADKPVSDDAINDQVRIKLATDVDVKGGNLGVDVKNGVVTLTGKVEQDKQRSKAARLAKKVRGVKEVINNITIQERTAGR
jgi:hyperosmotically inducible periplasmic protein